ncbi:MAG: hypothetical protein NTY22_03835 [Proteobacteria bacterium]|nr:hypothetical protein [Pseudomonadota bacterium]
MIVFLSLLMTLLNGVEIVTPYGAKDLSLGLGGRSFIDGYDAIRINPAGTGLLDSGQFGIGLNFGTYASLSVGYVGDNGFHLIIASKDIDRARTVESMETYIGYATQLSKWWVIGANLGYNYLKVKNGWDVNFGIDFGPGLPTAQKTGLIGSVTIRNPFENGGDGEVSAGLGYSYRSVFKITVDNIIVYRTKDQNGNRTTAQKRDDIVFAVESLPTAEENFSMNVSAKIVGVERDNNIQAGFGVGYVSESFRFDVGLYFTDFQTSFFKNSMFGFSLISGV